jgi:signal transduction histidine kinase
VAANATASSNGGADSAPALPSARDAISLTAIVLLLLTILMVAIPELPFVYSNLQLHVAFATIAAFVLVIVAIVLAGRYRRSGSGRDLVALAAILVLTGKNLFLSVLTAVHPGEASDFESWTFHGVRVLGAGLLAVAALMPARQLAQPRRAELLTLGGTLGAAAAIVLVTAFFGDALPGQFDDPPTDRESLESFGQQPVLTGLEWLAAVCYAVAAAGFAYHADRYRDRFQMWLGLYSVVAAVAFVNYAIYPTLFTELIYAGDILLLASILAMLYGTTREIAAFQGAVAQAAVLEERRRFARDLHDGVAQELAFIASQIRWSRTRPPGEDEMNQIMESVERALDESRGAIAALKRPVDEPLESALAHTAEDVAERLGGRLELHMQDGVQLPEAWREALTRIVREAVANAIRHGHARTIKVELNGSDGRVALRVSDDGAGFDPSQPHPNRFGLTSMRERAESLGGTFTLTSEPGKGTSVEVQVPS